MRKAAVVLLFVLLAGACSDPPRRPAFDDARALADAATTATTSGGSAKFGTDVAVGSVRSKGQGQARFGAAGTAQVMTTDFLGEPVELRLVAGKLYAKVPEGARDEVGTGKPWVAVAADGTDPFSQVLGASLTQLAAQNDPAHTLGEIRTAGTIVAAERTDLSGVAAEHYRVDLDLARLGTDLPAGLPADAAGRVGGKFPVELWLDETHRPLQIVLDLSPILQGEARITTRYTDWGTPVDVQPPPADEVG
ncbi:hypothetical protein AMES_7862 [Amycolatopsis mediterranei S699]|uniref:Lipoprotein n=2 Tax=Amycolatopsis mediterranei TaxID=33910 RepID=A0A0H3DFJ9_AMYMU|nr:hypothetical protein [Amycolatopsis mediterranei]ADJ49685.1 conserved hypothetical protein [Amycolatopsis mediterranei U32]AEK46669.1 hypothetical protein RAM_41010 [Amycolatopsis mediterranei S699]AFO81395.1 hypothetical protein AMES_7862 [Amycolatopsis mediterranei S699]AGT88523.1 hypothetical protein B737_7862 [Amycolatopsis mediterranei RB]KDO08066.1 hypothetical protein DV26_27665 [Amycolatopsis mediterranei]